jgi:hypothetical protein
MDSDNLIASPVFRPRRRLIPDWRLTIRFRHGEDDDLIEYLRALPAGQRAVTIREAVCQAVRLGLAYDGYWNQGTHRDQVDMRITIRFHHGRDDHAISFLRCLPSRKRSAFVRQALRVSLQTGRG